MVEDVGDGGDHRVPRRRQRASCARACGPCSASSPTSRSSASPATTTSSSPAPTRPSRRCVVTDIRMPPDFQQRGHRRGQGGAQAPSRHRRRGPLAVRRPRVRHLAARRGRGRLRLPAEGPRRRGRPARAGRPRGRHRRLGARPEDRRGARDARDRTTAGSPPTRRSCSQQVAEGTPDQGDRGRAAARRPAAVADAVEHLFLKLAQEATRGRGGSLRRLRMLHQAIVDREEQGETLSRLLPGGLAEKLRSEGREHRRDRGARRHRADVRHPRLLGHRRARPTRATLAEQLNEHRAEMNRAILDEGGTVMQFVGDAVMACSARRSRRTTTPTARCGRARRCSRGQAAVNVEWDARGPAAVRARHRPLDRRGRGRAARLGGAARVHAGRRHREPRRSGSRTSPGPAGRIVLSEATYQALSSQPAEREPSSASRS